MCLSVRLLALRQHLRLWCWSCGLVVLMLLVLTGCGEECSSCPSATPVEVKLPGLHLLHFMRPSPYEKFRPQVQGLAAYPSAATSNVVAASSQLLLTEDAHLMVLNTATGQEQFITNTTCLGRPALSPDHRWLVCLSTDGTEPFPIWGCGLGCSGYSISLLAISQLPNPTPATIIGVLPNDTTTSTDGYSSPIWSPDGHYLAVLHSIQKDTVCTIDIYAADPVHARFVRTATLQPVIGSDNACTIAQIAWSPTGPTLALVQRYESTYGPDGAALALLPIPDAALRKSAQNIPAVLQVAATSLIPRSDTFMVTQVLWTPDGHALLLNVGNAIISMDIPSQRQIPVFVIPTSQPNDPGVLLIAWGGDSHTLLLAFSDDFHLTAQNSSSSQAARAMAPAYCICPVPPTGIYQYTMPLSTQ